MAITYLGEQHFGSADNANTTTDPLVLDKDVAPFTTMQAGDVVVVYVSWRVAAGTCAVLEAGGQTWTEHFDLGTNLEGALYSCVFNGTWTADPSFDFSGTATGGIGWALAYSGVAGSSPWDVAPTNSAQAASTTYVEATYSTVTDGALALFGACSLDNNTWTVDNGFAAPSGSGNVYWTNAAGSDSSLALATKSIATAGAVGQTTLTQATLGGDAGQRWHGALRPVKIRTHTVDAQVMGVGVPRTHTIDADILKTITKTHTTDAVIVTTASYDVTSAAWGSSENSHCGPFADTSGNLYLFLKDDTNGYQLEAWKSGDGGQTWAEVDAANKPVTGSSGAVVTIATTQVGEVIHIATFSDTGTGGPVYYHTFRTSGHASPDTWGTKDNLIVTPSDVSAEFGAAIAVQSDGPIIVIYNGTSGTYFAGRECVEYAYSTNGGTNWTTGQQFLTTNSDNVAPVVVLGESQKIHGFASEEGSTRVIHRSLASVTATPTTAQSMSSGQTVTGFNYMTSKRAVYYDDGGIERVHCGFCTGVQGTGPYLPWSGKIEDDGTPASPSQITTTGVKSVTEYGPAGHLAAWGLAVNPTAKKVYAVFVSAADQDIYYRVNTDDGGWGSSDTLLCSATAMGMGARVYERSDKMYLGVYWDDGATEAGTTKFAALEIGDAPSHYTRTHTADAVISSGATTYTRTHTVDAVVQKTIPQTHTVDAVVLKTSTRTHTADAVVLKTILPTHTVDVVVLKTIPQTHSTDAVLLKTLLPTHTVDAVISAGGPSTYTRTHTVDAVVFQFSEWSNSDDAIISGGGTQTKTHTVDAVVLKTIALTHTVDAVVQKNALLTHTVDAVVLKTVTRTHTVDAVVVKTTELVHAADAVVLKTLTRAHTVDAYVSGVYARTHTADAVVLKTITRTHTVDAYVVGANTRVHTVDAVVRKTLTRTHTVDSYVVLRITRTHTVDAVVVKTATLTHTTDAFIQVAGVKQHTVNAVVLKTITRTHTVDAVVLKSATRTHTADAVVSSPTLRTHTVDASIKGIGLARVHAIDAVVRKTLTATHSVSAVIVKTFTRTHTTDAFVLVPRTQTHTVDAVVHKTLTQTHAVDAVVLVVGITRSHTVDAEIGLPYKTVAHTIDAYVFYARPSWWQTSGPQWPQDDDAGPQWPQDYSSGGWL